MSARTNEQGANQLAGHLRRLGYVSSIIDIRTKPTLLHLKSGIAYLGGGVWVVDDAVRRELGAVQGKVAGLRRFGAAALDMAFVAAGRLDGYWERNISPWDIAAGIIILREAGRFATDIDGADAMFTKKNIVVGNETIQRELQVLRKAAG